MSTRTDRNYRIADCCDNCVHSEEKYTNGPDDGDEFTEFAPVCMLDEEQTIPWFTCDRFEAIIKE